MERVVVDHPEECVTRIRLNRPDRLDAFTGAMVDDLAAAVTNATRDPECRVVVLTGTGRGFCSDLDAAALDLATTIAAHTGFDAILTRQVAQASSEAPSTDTAMLLEMPRQTLVDPQRRPP